jgi:hypothetical protein
VSERACTSMLVLSHSVGPGQGVGGMAGGGGRRHGGSREGGSDGPCVHLLVLSCETKREG